MIGVPAGEPIDLDLRLEAVMDGILVTGSADFPVRGECARCLEPVTDTAIAEFQELFRYPDEADAPGGGAARGPERSDTDVGGDDTEDYYLEGDVIDLEPVVRDAVVLALPTAPLCREDCPGLCVVCGARLADTGPDHRHDDNVDPRWAALRDLAPRPDDR